MVYLKMLYYIILIMFYIASCNSIQYYDVDPIIEMLMNDNIIEEYSENNDVIEDKFVYSDGLWKCGSCIDFENVIYNEVYDFNSNNIVEDNEVQVGISVERMRCVTVKANDEASVSIVGGSCSGELTLRLVHTQLCEINIYS